MDEGTFQGEIQVLQFFGGAQVTRSEVKVSVGGADNLEDTMHQAILKFPESNWQTILHTFPEFASSNTDIFIEFLTD